MKKEDIFKNLNKEDEKEFRAFVDENEETMKFINKVRLWHPVIRDEICRRIK